MRDNTCCFTGHRKISVLSCLLLKIKLYFIINKLIKKHINCFYVGGAIGFDTLAAQSVLKFKRHYNHLKLILVIPCRNQTKYWNDKEKRKYNHIKSQADKTVILSEKYFNGCMQKRNRYLIDNSSYCICYLRKRSGGTAYTVNYAIRNNRRIIYL